MSDSASEVGRYASRTRLPGLWLPVHLLLVFVPFLAGFIIAGNTTSTVDILAMLAGLGGMALLGGPLKERSVVWTAFVLMVLFPKRSE